jgi:hypothetical protein
MREDNWKAYMEERRTRVSTMTFVVFFVLVTYRGDGSRLTT